MAAKSNIPKNNYPRPEARREDWLNLNGTWQFQFDPSHEGMKQHWFLPSKKEFELEITVPFVFQSELSGINSQEFTDTVWYKRKFSIPEEYNSKSVLLHFGAVDYQCEVFVNGSLVGTHQGGLTPFHFDITSYLSENKQKPHTLIMKVWDPPFDQSIPRGKQTTKKFLDGCSYEKVLGIWQTVWLEFVSCPHFKRDDYYIRPNLEEQQIATTITIEGNLSPQFVIEAQAFDGEKPISNVSFVMPQGTFGIPDMKNEIILKFKKEEIELWGPDHPKLYQMHFRLIDGDEEEEPLIDELRCSFGFRTIEFKEGKFHLNGNPLYLKQALYQGYWPKGLWTAPSDEKIKRDLELTLEMGYNSLRLHQIVAEPRLLHWADKMGIILWGEMANSFGNDARAKDNFIQEWSEIVRRDRCHPSIVVWSPLNESWGTGDLTKNENQEWLRSVYHWTKTMDPTRFVNDNDGWEHVLTDIATIHKYCYADEFAEQFPEEKPEDLAEFLSNVKPSRLTFAPGAKSRGEPVMISEWGGWGMNLDDPDMEPNRKKAWGYQGILYDTFDEVLELYKNFIEELVKRKEWICGHCYTEFNDQYQEMNGMLTFDRRAKGDLSKLKKINDMLFYE